MCRPLAPSTILLASLYSQVSHRTSRFYGRAHPLEDSPGMQWLFLLWVYLMELVVQRLSLDAKLYAGRMMIGCDNGSCRGTSVQVNNVDVLEAL